MSSKIKLPRRLPSEEPEVIEVIAGPSKKSKPSWELPAMSIEEEIEEICALNRKASRGKKSVGSEKSFGSLSSPVMKFNGYNRDDVDDPVHKVDDDDDELEILLLKETSPKFEKRPLSSSKSRPSLSIEDEIEEIVASQRKKKSKTKKVEETSKSKDELPSSLKSWPSNDSFSAENDADVGGGSAGKGKVSRKRLTEEEKAAKKAEKEKIAAEKRKKNQVAKASKEAAKELDKALKKSVQEAKRMEAPGNAVKTMTVLIPDGVASKFDGACAFLVASEVKYETVSNPILDNVILFRRDLTHKTLGDDLQMANIVRSEEEDNVLFLMYPEEYIPKINDQLQQQPNCMISYMQEMQSLFLDKKLTVFFMDFEKYVRKQKKNTNQDFRNLVLNEGAHDAPTAARKRNKKPELPAVSLNDLNSAIVELQLMTHVNYRVIKDGQELGLQLFQFAKAIAEAPYKRKKMQDGFDWYALSDSGNIKVDKEGKGLSSLWIDQLMQFNNVGIDTAQAIAKKYPSPKALMQAYDSCETLEDGLLLLQNVPVRLGIGVLAKTRRVGPELSKRVYRFFTCSTGDRSLASSHDT